MRSLLRATLFAGAAGLALAAAQLPASPGAPAVRYHHVHFRSDDPTRAMAEAVRTGGGTRVLLQGLGVGVRRGTTYLLFDRWWPGNRGCGWCARG